MCHESVACQFEKFEPVVRNLGIEVAACTAQVKDMKLSIRAHGISLSPSQRHLIERRVRFALTRFGATVPEVECFLSDQNGPRGGVDKVCILRLHPHGARRVVIEQASENVEGAVDLAVGRAARAVARGLHRGRARRAVV